jgi:hypothetical protein
VCACDGEKGTETSGRGEWVGWIGFRWIGLAWENLPVGYGNSVRHGYKVICGGTQILYTTSKFSGSRHLLAVV